MACLRRILLLALGGGIGLAASSNESPSHHGPTPFELDLTWETRAPDGVPRKMILVNGQSPGPPLNIKEGDDVEVLVKNRMPFGTTVHFHGIDQLGTPWSDGVPGLSQELIEPGSSFTYKWTATQYGTYWYHAHSGGQVMDGLHGPIHIQPASYNPSPFHMISKDSSAQALMQKAEDDPKLITISDWNHLTSQELREVAVSANVDVLCFDTVLINGKGAVNCQSPELLASFIPPPLIPFLDGQTLTDKGCLPLVSSIFQTDTPHRYDLVPESLWSGCSVTQSAIEVIKTDAMDGWMSLNFISAASDLELTVSIDEHPMWVYAADGRYVEPQEVEAITFPHGTRYSTMIKLDKPPGDYTIRVASTGFNQKVSGYAVLSYENGNKSNLSEPYINYGGLNTTANVRYLTESTLRPFPPVQPAQTADATHKLTIGRIENAWTWSMDGQDPFVLALENETPLLWDPASAKFENLTVSTINDSWVDIIMETSPLEPSHPIHKHSNKGHLIGSGSGPFTWSTVAEALVEISEAFNLENPPFKDTFYTPAAAATAPSWMVIRYHVINPGAFLLHCHINPHLEGGMALAILDGIDAWPRIPDEYGPRPHWKHPAEESSHWRGPFSDGFNTVRRAFIG